MASIMEKVLLRGGVADGIEAQIAEDLDWLDYPIPPSPLSIPISSPLPIPFRPSDFESYRRSAKTRTIFVYQP